MGAPFLLAVSGAVATSTTYAVVVGIAKAILIDARLDRLRFALNSRK